MYVSAESTFQVSRLAVSAPRSLEALNIRGGCCRRPASVAIRRERDRRARSEEGELRQLVDLDKDALRAIRRRSNVGKSPINSSSDTPSKIKAGHGVIEAVRLAPCTGHAPCRNRILLANADPGPASFAQSAWPARPDRYSHRTTSPGSKGLIARSRDHRPFPVAAHRGLASPRSTPGSVPQVDHIAMLPVEVRSRAHVHRAARRGVGIGLDWPSAPIRVE